MRATRGAALAALVALGVGLGGCGGGGSSTPTGPGPLNVLASIPDTAAYRSLVEGNDLAGMWQSAGLSFPPSQTQAGSPAGAAASRQILDGSQVGSRLWAFSPPGTEPLGYDPFAVSDEVVAGQPPNDLSVVQGTIDASQLGGALAAAGIHPVSSGAVIRYTITDPAKLPEGLSAALLDVRNLAVLPRGGTLSAGGSGVAFGDVINLLQSRHLSPSLASDPAIKQVLGLIKGADVMVFGTSLVVKGGEILGPRASPQAIAQLGKRLGLDRLPAAPTFAGYGYLPGTPTNATAVAVAIYPNAKDAHAAASIVGNVLRFGVSPRNNEPYSQVLAVETIAIHGNALVARLTNRQPGVMAQAVAEDDFPLFWSPLP